MRLRQQLRHLKVANPAADSKELYAWIVGATAENGLYKSNGSAWVLQLSSSGDRTDLWDYAGGLTYGTTNELLSPSTKAWKQADMSTDSSGNTSLLFNGTTTDYASMLGTPIDRFNSVVYALTASSETLGKFKYYNATAYASNETIEIVGMIDSTTVDVLTPTSITAISGTGFSISGDSIIGIGVSDAFEVIVANATAYAGYGYRYKSSGASPFRTGEFMGYEVIDNTSTIDAVRSINKIHAGQQAVTSTIVATTVTLDGDDGFVPCDCTTAGADITVTLPAIASSEGKIYTIKKIDSGEDTVIIDGDSAETIDGETTVVLATQYDSVTIIGGASEWHII